MWIRKFTRNIAKIQAVSYEFIPTQFDQVQCTMETQDKDPL